MKREHRQLPLYMSAPHACSYLEDRQSSTLFTDPDAAMDMEAYSELLRHGFRRSGRMVYSPRCETCRQCVSVRLPVGDFQFRRQHRRTLRANADVQMRKHPATFNPAHYALYQQYTKVLHSDGEMANATQQDYMSFLTAAWSDTFFLEFWHEEQLIAVAVTDRSDDGLSAVYTFFNPGLRNRSLGKLAILRQIEHARHLGLPYLYLGYWIRDSRKMAYKIDFRPIELWREGCWQRLEPGETPVD